MASLDSKVAAVVDNATKNNHDSDDEDALIAALEEDDSELDAFREQRLQQLHAEYNRAKQLKASDHGTYAEIKDEKVLLDLTTSTKKCVVHFFKPDFGRCRVMDGHLEVSDISRERSSSFSFLFFPKLAVCILIPFPSSSINISCISASLSPPPTTKLAS